MSTVLGWGKASSGALGLGGSECSSVTTPQQILALEDVEIRNISAGENHTLVSLRDGTVLSCGTNDFGQCGQEHSLHKFGRIQNGLQAQSVIEVVAGASHSVALTQLHELFTWGRNDEGQLGRGDVQEDLRGVPRLVKSLAVHCVLQVACGNNHTLALTNEGLVRVWGSNSYGQLGLGKSSGVSQNTPKILACLKGIPVRQISAGGNHSFILSKSGAIFGWGRNSFGQLGVNTTRDLDFPLQCRSMRTQKIKYICCGENHSAALTMDGRVFTFGAGSYGQLGHSSNNNEVLPRQVIELSGSKVSQITCGRGHTLAYVPASGRLYAFGLGGSGQLGLGATDNRSSPFAVKCSFCPDTGSGGAVAMQVDNEGPEMRVKSIYVGGDQSFVLAQDADTCHSDDFRLEDPTRQILTLSQERIEMICHLKSDDTPSDEQTDEMTKIFSNASCLNGSFLEANDGHYGSSSKKHGVDMTAVRQFFQALAELSNIMIKQYISTSLSQDLIPKLPRSPPDVEALRLFLILPECHLLEEPKLYDSIICPFANAFLAMDKLALKVFDSWWPSNQPSFFNRLVVIYKSCIEHLLQLPDTTNHLEVTKRQEGLFSCMKMLQKLNEINEANNQIIPYHKFYVPELKERVNIREDYISWVQRKHLHTQGLYFCNYPFLFDSAAKSVLLQTDAALQMRNAIESVQRRNLIGLFGMALPRHDFDTVNPCLILHISRDNLVHDTLIQLQDKHSADLKKPLKVVFKGEEAVDEGGVRKEFFMLLLREVMDPKYGMFNIQDLSNLQWFNASTFEEPKMFNMIGILCGLAIYNFTIIELHFPLALYKKMLKRPVSLDDLKELMPEVGKGLQDLIDFDGDEFEEVFCLTFEVMREQFGETKSMPLCEDGRNTSVNQNNKNTYIELYVDYILNRSVELQFNAFSEGFHCVCGGEVLELFHPQELQAMVVGNEDYDFEQLEENTDYKGEYHRYHPTIKFFWEVFHDMSLEDKKKFLLFLTGSDRIPVFGMKYVKIIIQPTGGGEDYLPAAHTCFNILDLPRYSSKEILQAKLLLAIQQTEGFGLV